MSAVPSACYDSGSEDFDEEENLECFGEKSPLHIQKKLSVY